jgi:hypothetical protein
MAKGDAKPAKGDIALGTGGVQPSQWRPHARLLRWRQRCGQYRRMCSRSMEGSITWGSVMCRAVASKAVLQMIYDITPHS